MSISVHAMARAERGAVLLVMLVMLAILTVIVASMVNTSSVNLQVIGNQQYRYEAKLTVQNAIETFISNADNFSASPPAALPIGLDLDGDGTDEYTASAPIATCLSTVRVKPAELNVTSAADRSCINSQNLQIWIDGGALPAESNCQNIIWDVGSQIADAGTGAKVELHQGIAQRAKIDVACP